ncbi:hypothetical protein ACFOD4_11245 [Pseudoroseomonas globiformis]|uniref:PepSY domain-containing protein n=1 Tax=Teichococcus globiformis TaxID=2307229 RepID=A0ABV7G1T8_9PROT
MRIARLAGFVAAVLMAAPAAWAQAQPGGGTAGSPEQPRGGGTTMQQGTPGMNNPGATTPGATTGTTGTGAAGSGERRDPPTTQTPAAGSNSFTEGQARSRIEAAGYTDVQELRQDDQGVWRGKAMRNGTQSDVGLDFQGNVVTGSGAAR